MLLSCSKPRVIIPKDSGWKPGPPTGTTGTANTVYFSSRQYLSISYKCFSVLKCSLTHGSVPYRDGEDWKHNRIILNREVISPKVQGNFVPLLDEVGQDFVARVYKKIERSGKNEWTTDLSHELFKYALECKLSDFYDIMLM